MTSLRSAQAPGFIRGGGCQERPAAHMPGMTTTNQNRKSKGQPVGGQFAGKQRPDSPVILDAARTTFGGYELRGYKKVGRGMESSIWTATIYRYGKAVVHVTDDGNGGDLRMVDKATGRAHYGDEIEKFKAQASQCLPAYQHFADGVFAEFLHVSAQMDKIARVNAISKQKVYDYHLEADLITDEEYKLLSNPNGVPLGLIG